MNNDPESIDRKKRIVLLEAGEPGSNVIGKFMALDSLPACEPCLVYWGRDTTDASYPLASEIPKERVYTIGSFARGRQTNLVTRFRVCLEASRLLRQLKPWCVQSSSLDFLLIAILSIRPTAGFVFNLQDSRPWMHRGWIRFLVRMLLRRTKLVTVTSPRFESQFLRKYQLIPPNHPVVCMPNPVEQIRFQQYRPRPVDQDVVIGYIGTFRGETAIRALVEGIGQARQRGIPAKGFFAGIGPALPLVKHYCESCNFIQYNGPFDQSRDLSGLYGQVNIVYAVYDNSEDKRIHWACRLGEAVFARVPIIVMSGSFMAELVAEHGLGFAIPLGDARAFADVVETVWRDRTIYREIAGRCETAEPFFDSESYTAKYLDAYRTLLG